MLAYNEIKERKYIVLDGDPYEVIDSHVFRKQQRKPVNQVKLRNLISGSIRAETFHVNDTAQEADLEKKKVKFIFKKFNSREKRTEFWFSDIEKPNRFEISEELIGNNADFLKENTQIEALVFDEKIIGVTVPIKIELKVVEAPPAVKGNSATGATKQIKLETGLIINAPLFINEGDVIRINTENREYVERV
ncbi:MAG TPA: elongation factor P [Candidatus Paceibacterota bacterium]|nr:elongation factor P [Candidatus Paceibacterota bacterium]HMP19215.1 elongation factor P [Candidatus Paceibacterota bacterium]HMP85343.1 elongation factor P [Candidatus Paceibacterota bacterium]